MFLLDHQTWVKGLHRLCRDYVGFKTIWLNLYFIYSKPDACIESKTLNKKEFLEFRWCQTWKSTETREDELYGGVSWQTEGRSLSLHHTRQHNSWAKRKLPTNWMKMSWKATGTATKPGNFGPAWFQTPAVPPGQRLWERGGIWNFLELFNKCITFWNIRRSWAC